MFILRPYQISDCQEVTELFFQTVHRINIQDYSLPQVNAWADGKPDLQQWNRTLLSHHTLIAESNSIIVGFGDISSSGYLDHLYVHYAYQHQGIATALCNALETSVTVPCISTHASITARGFFEKRGYRLIREQQVERHQVMLTNFVMEYRRYAASHHA